MIESQLAQTQNLFSAWHRFWFTPTDPIVPSAARVLSGGMLFYTLLVWSVDLESFFSSQTGWQSLELVERLQQQDAARSLWWLVPDAHLWAAHIVFLVIVGMYWLGLGTTVTKWCALVIAISYCNRVPLANYGLDQINVMLTLYLCLGPCGRRLSLDHAIGRRWQRLLKRESRLPGPSETAGLSIRMIQVHMCLIYVCAGLSKLQGESWWNGQAVWRAAANYEYQQFSLTWLAEAPWLYQIATIGTWMWEISFVFLVWNRYARLPVLMIGLSMHLGIGMFMGMWTFGLIMCFAYTAFVPAAVLYRALSVFGIERPADRESIVQENEQPVYRLPYHSRDDAKRLLFASSDSEFGSAVPTRTGDGNVRGDQTVIFVESNLKNRAKITSSLHRMNYQCIAVDAWPEALSIHRSIRARTVLCNATKLPPSELLYWTHQLEAIDPDASRPVARCIALVKSSHPISDHEPNDTLAVVTLPLEQDDLDALLDGHFPTRLSIAEDRRATGGRSDEFLSSSTTEIIT